MKRDFLLAARPRWPWPSPPLAQEDFDEGDA